jgi:type VI secretion system protein ImpL
VWVVRKILARRRARALENALDEEAEKAARKAASHKKEEVAALRTRMQDAIKTLRSSKLGQLSGEAALYELPWYLVIGNPAAGKSTAIVKSGLKFPFADSAGSVIQGIGGTRNCDWFFTSEGILVDTAGRYSVHEEDREEWLGFLGLLKKHRPKAPVNGIIIVASVADLASQKPEQSIQLAKSLRQRVQELTEKLEVFAPVYLMFTKADLIAGFTEFFEDRDPSERDRVWGATFAYSQEAPAAGVAAFDARFDELVDGLKEMSVAHMSVHRGEQLPPGVLTFPVEFAALKPVFSSFIATLFEENPYQFRPVFRGFYFTSSLQQGNSTRRATDRVAQSFGLTHGSPNEVTGLVVANNGFFLRDLFAKVIFGDKALVRQYASRGKLRLRGLSIGLATVALALALGAWTWSYLGNRQLLDDVRADLDKVVRLQSEQTELGPRLEGLLILQDRIEQMRRYRDVRPWGISMGLYQGETIDQRLREEYFAGIKQVMLDPVAQLIEGYLGEVNLNPARLKPMSPTAEGAAAKTPVVAKPVVTTNRFVDASVESSADAYNALKTYLMLGDRNVMDAGHLNDQLTRFWRGWLDDNRGALPRDALMRNAERLISFTTANASDPLFPTLSPKFVIVDQTRGHLRELVRGMRGIDRVYTNVKARAATRFPPITVAGLMTEANRDVVAGSYVVPGTFTQEAWVGYVEKAFKEASTTELQNRDWVLNTTNNDDLTLVGSPDQIRKMLTEMYKTEYVREWQRFMQGITVNGFEDFPQAVVRMNRLGDTQVSPIRAVMTTLFDQTTWDNPSILNDRLAKTQTSVIDWFKSSILRMAPSRVEVKVDIAGADGAIPMGPIGREFSSLLRIMHSKDGNPTPMSVYLQHLSKLRTRFNQIGNQGDSGPGARALLASTLEGSNSELSDTLRHVEEQMLVNMTDTAKAAIRPILVRPLIEAMGVLVEPTELELNRIWEAQVRGPFERALASKYPFDTNSKMEATVGDISKIFGPTGSISKFTGEALGPLVVRRGDVIDQRTWADVGIRLRPAFVTGVQQWIQPIEGPTMGSAPLMPPSSATGGAPAAATSAGPGQTLFQIQPQGSPGIAEYTLVVDGQSLRYRNAAADWVSMVWPNPAGVAGVRITAVTNDGNSLEMLNEPGQAGLQRMMDAATRTKLSDGTTLMTWSKGTLKVNVIMRLLSTPGADPAPPRIAGGGKQGNGAAVVDEAPALGGIGRLRGVKLPALVAGLDRSGNPAAGTFPAGAKPAANTTKP